MHHKYVFRPFITLIKLCYVPTSSCPSHYQLRPKNNEERENFTPFEEYNLRFMWLLHLDMKKKERLAYFPETKYFHLFLFFQCWKVYKFSRRFCLEREGGGGVGFLLFSVCSHQVLILCYKLTMGSQHVPQFLNLFPNIPNRISLCLICFAQCCPLETYVGEPISRFL